MSNTITITASDSRGNPIVRKIKPGRYLECGCCGGFHHESYYGDCRNDEQRFSSFDLEGADGEPVSQSITLVPLTEVPADI